MCGGVECAPLSLQFDVKLCAMFMLFTVHGAVFCNGGSSHCTHTQLLSFYVEKATECVHH